MPARLLSRLVVLVAIVLAVVACGGGDPPSGSPPAGGSISLADTSWVVLVVNDRPPVAGAVPTITFTADTITGSGGCNHLGGRYQLDPASGQIAVSELGATAMGCLQAGVGDYETLFLQALGSTNQAGIDRDGQLNLRGPGGLILLATLEHPAQSG
jgi:heat shock protein HslJ